MPPTPPRFSARVLQGGTSRTTSKSWELGAARSATETAGSLFLAQKPKVPFALPAQTPERRDRRRTGGPRALLRPRWPRPRHPATPPDPGSMSCIPHPQEGGAATPPTPPPFPEEAAAARGGPTWCLRLGHPDSGCRGVGSEAGGPAVWLGSATGLDVQGPTPPLPRSLSLSFPP